MNCNTCIQCSLDGCFCHLHHRPTTPEGSCSLHSTGSDRQTQLRTIVMLQTKKSSLTIKNN